MPSVLTDAPFAKTTLTYSVPTGAWTTDGNGNQIPATSSGTLTAFVSVDRARQLRQQPGADPRLTPITIELDNPLALPVGVTLGSVLTFTWDGAAVQAVITSVSPNDIPGVDFGTVIRADMTPA